jgi:hypothetical protein
MSALWKKLGLLTTAATAIALGGAGTAHASAPGQLDSGAQLNPGDTRYSPNGSQALTMQTDGNLVLYAPGHVAIWESHTDGHAGSILIEQTDGNLVVVAPGNVSIWWTGTSGHPGTVLQVQDDGNAVQYAPGHVAIWSTKFGGGGSAASSGLDKIAALATANEGRTACGPNTLGGRGYYSSCTGNDGRPEYWCSDFAMWVWANAGYRVDGLSAAAYSFVTYGRNAGTAHGSGYRPQVGDAVVYDVVGTTASHVGIVTGVGDGVIHTANGDFGGVGTGSAFAASASVVAKDLPGTATIGTRTAFGKTISAIVSPAR